MFYDKFAQLCKSRGITVTKAITEMGFSRSLGSKWKKTNATPNGETLQIIAEYFGVSVSSLLSDEEEPIGYDSFTYAMHGASDDLTDRDKQLLVDMANQLANANRERKKRKDGEDSN